MTNNSLLIYQNETNSHLWTTQALASCRTLNFIAIYLCFVFIFGVYLNIFVIYTIIKQKVFQSPINIFFITLAISDLAHALLAIPLPLSSNFACRWLYGKYLCYYEGFIAYFVGMIGLYLLTTLSLNRYWLINTPRKTTRVVVQRAYISVFISVLGGFFWASAPLFGWSYYTLEGVLTSCSIHWQDRTWNVISYNIMMFIFAYMIPLIIMFYCNIKIYFKVHNTSRQIITWESGVKTFQIRHKEEIDRHIARTVILIVLTFTIAWSPYAIVAFISSFISPTFISPLGATLPAIFAKSSIYFNPLVYLAANSRLYSLFDFYTKTYRRTSNSSLRENQEHQFLEACPMNAT